MNIMDEANTGEVMTRRFDRYDGTPFLRPAYYPDTEVVVEPVQAAQGTSFRATIYINFGERGVMVSGLGRTPREAVRDLHDAVKKSIGAKP